MKGFLSILLISFTLSSAFAQPDWPLFKNISTLNGLSQNWVRTIYQDDLGYMWFGTAYGLNRYDGYEFKIFLPNPRNPFSIGSMFINKIAKKSNHELWICTQNGVYIYDQLSEKFHSFKPLKGNDIISVFEDSEKVIWFGGTKGLFRYNPVDSSLIKYTSDVNKPGSISNDNIRVIYEDKRKNLWIGSLSGLDLYNREKDVFQNFLPSKSIEGCSSDLILAIQEDQSGKLWIGIIQVGLAIFEYSPNDPVKSRFNLVIKGSGNCFTIDNDSNLWFGNGGGLGLNIFKIKDYKINQRLKYKSYFQTGYSDNGLSSNSISSIYKDKLGDIWIGTYGGGVDYYSKRSKKFNTYGQSEEKMTLSSNLVNVLFEEDKYLWIGTENGLERKDLKTGKIRTFKHDKRDPSSIGANAIYDIFKDSRGILWIGSWNGGLSRYNYQTETFKNFLPDKRAGSINNHNVFAIAEDKDGNLWLATIYGGLNKFDFQKGTFTSYIHNDTDPNSLNGNIAHHVFISKQNQIWVSLYESALDLLDESSGSFKHFVHDPENPKSIGPGFILSVFEDSKNNIWVASNIGLNLFEPENNSFRHFTTDDGLPNNSIQSILEDDKGNLWLGTNGGLAVFYDAINKPVTPVFRIYDKDDGLPGNEFALRSCFKNKLGFLYFGTSQGFTWFHPDSIKDNLISPNVVINSFELLQAKDTKEEKNLLLHEDYFVQERLKLSYTQSDFIVKYAALNYLNSEKNRYKYRLVGYEDEWHFVGNQRSATYTNIQPGDYTFMVYGSNNDGIWSELPNSVRIVITPPWWQTFIFRIIAVILFTVTIITIFKLRMKMLEKQKRILKNTVAERTLELMETNSRLEEKSEEIAIQNEELSKHRNNLEQLVEERTSELANAKIKAEESDRLKSSFLANMSHEIRTPMNAIIGFASLLDEDNLNNDEKRKYIQMININSETLMVLIDDILDISLIESNQLVFAKNVFDATKVLIELEDYYTLKNTKNLAIEFVNNRNDKLFMELDQVRFWQILNNLVNNAYKYTEKGSIKFGYEKFPQYYRFYVSDTGSGIEPEHFESIFDHFSKIENKNRQFQRGTGIGLAICKSLVNKMGGEIWVESTIGVGSTFYFTIPVQELEYQNFQNAIKHRTNIHVNNLRIVIAEDEPINFELLNMYLKNIGVNIIWAKNGHECIEYINSITNYEGLIVLMDIKMPIINGYDTLHEIKKIAKKIPVIAVTAYVQTKDKERLLNAGFDEYLPKPLRRDSLLKTISKFVGFNRSY